MRVIRALVTLAAVWGALITLLLASGRVASLPAGLRGERSTVPPTTTPQSPASCVCETTPKAATQPAPDSRPAAASERSPIIAAHYAVCEREEGAPTFSQLELDHAAAPLFALHCGPSAHLIAVAAGGPMLVPRRVLELHVASHSPAEAPHAGAIFAADVDGDGRSDLLAEVLSLDRGGAPYGGAIYLLRRRAEGSFDSATRLLELAAGGGVAATLDAQPGMDLALLHLLDARSARSSELWLVHGGPAPLRSAKLEAGVGANALAAADLDLDGIDDVAVVSERDARVRLFLSGSGPEAKREPVVFELPGVREALSGDLDGDGHRELVLTGERVWIVRPQKGAAPKPMPIADSALLRDTHLVDVDHDGKLDVVGYAHPSVIVLRQTSAFEYARETFASLRGDMGVLFARLAFLDDDPRPELVLSLVSTGPDAQIEFGLAPNLALGSEVQLATESQSLHDGALPQRFALP